ncbi:hypothetical protein B0I26_11411 [Anoxybacillus vitaminiphilus]|uniref:Uncharacterized protein n=1 Tax=Paranoxybacillus vitaminiphilus TaxID=581036 RepID=A0A327Y952_9BACL|nr:hypothetical protein [Anoxybacillus vitaminiphilus]RAK17007.1 hypothetical protein B0I26_11411 [Anoxybacillus vitaminiphilus]
MDKKTCWIVIFLSLAVNVVMLQWTVEAYFGLEYERVYLFTSIACLSVLAALAAFFRWRNLEYKEKK